MLCIREPPLQHLEIAGNHGEKIVEVVGDAACKLADGLHLLRLAEVLLHLDSRCQVPDEAGEDMCPAKRHLADREVHRKDRAILAPRLDLAADADDVLLAGPQVSGQVAVMALPMRRAHEHIDVAPDDFAGSVTEQFLRGAAEGLDDTLLVDRYDRVGGGLENGTEPRLTFFKHRFGVRFVSVTSESNSRSDAASSSITGVQCPLACDHQSTAIAMCAHEFACHTPVSRSSA